MNDDDDTVQINLTRMKFYIKYITHVHLKLLLFYSFFFPSCACASVALLFFRLSVYAIALHNKATLKTATAGRFRTCKTLFCPEQQSHHGPEHVREGIFGLSATVAPGAIDVQRRDDE